MVMVRLRFLALELPRVIDSIFCSFQNSFRYFLLLVVTLRVLRKCDPRKGEYIRVQLTTRDKLDGQQGLRSRGQWQ